MEAQLQHAISTEQLIRQMDRSIKSIFFELETLKLTLLKRATKLFHYKKLILTAGLLLAGSTSAFADEIVFNNWTTNYLYSGNYILEVNNDTAGYFDYSLTVNPWNAESTGLFIDLGNFDLPGDPFADPLVVDLHNDNPAGTVSLYTYDSNSPDCGAGCSLATLDPEVQPYLAAFDSEWELVFRLGEHTFDDIQTFSFRTSDFGLDLSAFEMAAVRSNQFCHGDDLLPDDEKPCYFGNKAYSNQPQPQPGPTVSEPGITALFAIALGIAGFARRNSA